MIDSRTPGWSLVARSGPCRIPCVISHGSSSGAKSQSGRLAKSDTNLRVRRYALGVLRGVADLMQAKERAAGPEKKAG